MKELPDITCIVVAGGKSRRMGQDKALLTISGVPMIQHIYRQLKIIFNSFLISNNTPEKFAFLGLPMVRDLRPDAGPLMGIYSSMLKCSTSAVFSCACDIPEIPLELIHEMHSHLEKNDIVIPVTYPQGQYEPLFAFYSMNCLKEIENAIMSGENKISSFFSSQRIYEFTFPENVMLKNLNSHGDYLDYLKTNVRPE